MNGDHVCNGAEHQQIDKRNMGDMPQGKQTRVRRVLGNPGHCMQILQNQLIGLLYPPHMIGLIPLFFLRQFVQNGAQVGNAAVVCQPLLQRKQKNNLNKI